MMQHPISPLHLQHLHRLQAMVSLLLSSRPEDSVALEEEALRLGFGSRGLVVVLVVVGKAEALKKKKLAAFGGGRAGNRGLKLYYTISLKAVAGKRAPLSER